MAHVSPSGRSAWEQAGEGCAQGLLSGVHSQVSIDAIDVLSSIAHWTVDRLCVPSLYTSVIVAVGTLEHRTHCVVWIASTLGDGLLHIMIEPRQVLIWRRSHVHPGFAAVGPCPFAVCCIACLLRPWLPLRPWLLAPVAACAPVAATDSTPKAEAATDSNPPDTDRHKPPRL